MLSACNGCGETDAVAAGMSHKRGKVKREHFCCTKPTEDVLLVIPKRHASQNICTKSNQQIFPLTTGPYQCRVGTTELRLCGISSGQCACR